MAGEKQQILVKTSHWQILTCQKEKRYAKTKKGSSRLSASQKRKAPKPIPEFKSLEEKAYFWDTHDTTEYVWEDLDETIEAAGPLKARVEKRRIERLATLLKLTPKQLRAAQRIARRKGVTSDTLIKTWINDGLRRESAGI